MSYVPATFTAGIALTLTVAGAVGGQWVSDIRRSAIEPSPMTVEERARNERQPKARAIAPAAAVPAAETPAVVETPVLVTPTRMKLREAVGTPAHKMAPADARAKRLRNDDVKRPVGKRPHLTESEGLPLQAMFDISHRKADSWNGAAPGS